MFNGKKISISAAVSRNGVYGRRGEIPWHIPEELKLFRNRTIARSVIMGRVTWESLPQSVRPLPKRDNIVLTNNSAFHAPGAKVATSFDAAILAVEQEEVFVIGGWALWFEALEFADEAWITVVQEEYLIDQATKTAGALIDLDSYWPEFSLSEITKYKASANAPGFDVHHWVRR